MLRVAEHWSGTDTGRQRRANEDSLLVRSPLFVVADGMGGAQAGEVASRMAVETFKHGLEDRSDPRAGLAELIERANARINERSHRDARHAGMGTTITAVYVGERDVSIAHVGDSRAYCLRDGELLRLTDDHSLVDELIRQGKLTPEQAEEHPQRSVITRALGPEASVEVDTRSFGGRPGDVYLLCSDGLTTMVGEESLADLLGRHARLPDVGQALIQAANQAGGKDNITVVLARLDETPASGEPRTDGHAAITDTHTLGGAPDAAAEAPTSTGMRPVSGASLAETAPSALTGGASPPRAGALRAPRQATAARGRRRRHAGLGLALALVLGLLAAGAYVAIESVYFLGTNDRGLVTIFRGVPFELPGGLRLYSSDYVSGVSAARISSARRATLLDHSLRSEKDAAELVRQLELGELSER